MEVYKLVSKKDIFVSGRLGKDIEEKIFSRDANYFFVDNPSKKNYIGICDVKEVYILDIEELIDSEDSPSDWKIVYKRDIDQCNDLSEFEKHQLKKLSREWLSFCEE